MTIALEHMTMNHATLNIYDIKEKKKKLSNVYFAIWNQHHGKKKTITNRTKHHLVESSIWHQPVIYCFFSPYECGLFASINRIPDFHPGHGMAISQSVNAYLRVSPPNLDIYLTMYLQSTGMKMIQKIWYNMKNTKV